MHSGKMYMFHLFRYGQLLIVILVAFTAKNDSHSNRRKPSNLRHTIETMKRSEGDTFLR